MVNSSTCTFPRTFKRLTNSLAVELGEFGIRVNSVHPYGTDTPMGNDPSMWQMFADHQNYIHSFSPGALPTDSLADPDLVSNIVLWLASDDSRDVNGEIFAGSEFQVPT